MKTLVTAVALAFAIVPPLTAAEAPSAKIGRATPSWKDLPGTDDKRHALTDLKGKEVVVVAITCNHCPIAIEYYERIKDFVARRCGADSKVALVAISVSDMETDKLPRMKEMAERQKFNFPYLYDASQQIAKDLGATNTPQFFVLDKNRVLVYRGAWDDDVNPARVTKRYVEQAVDAVLAGKTPPTTETRARGCLITYVK